MGLIRIAEPVVEPITLAEAKVQCRVDAEFMVDDDLILTKIVAARGSVEGYLRRALVAQTWRLTLDRFPCATRDGPAPNPYAKLPLPRPNLLAVKATIELPAIGVTYVDPEGVLQTLDVADYEVDVATLPGTIYPAYGLSWPATRVQPNAVSVSFRAGYGTTAVAVPSEVRSAVLLHVGDLYRNREAQAELLLNANKTVCWLLDQHRFLEAA